MLPCALQTLVLYTWNSVPLLDGSSLLSSLASSLSSCEQSVQQTLSLGVHPIVLHTHTHPPSEEIHLGEAELHYQRITSFE